jgi:GTP-binding protein
MNKIKGIRNVAIIAHVDHGKTTLVDKIIYQTNVLSKHKHHGELILDSNDLERERGITIVSKNIAVRYKDYKINIIDTPGHSDFGGEVERVLNMAEGVLLLVDAFEGTMPQTRFVLQKAIQLGLKPVVVINKVDKPNCRPDIVQEQVFDLMVNLNATEEQLDFVTVFGSAKEGWMSSNWEEKTDNIYELLDGILNIIPEPHYEKGNLQLQITSIEHSPYVGRIAIGKVKRGEIRNNETIALLNRNNDVSKQKIKELYVFDGLGKRKEELVFSGDIAAVVGIENFEIGDTICDLENPEALKTIPIDEPTMSMMFTINNSPFFGKEGKLVTSRHIKERLEKELEKNLALRVEDTNSPEMFTVKGRGILHLSVLIETMRREGYELQIGQPKVLFKEIDGEKCEPIEILIIDVTDEYSGKVIEMVNQRKGSMINMERHDDRVLIEFYIPSRGIIGLRNNVLTATAGEAVINHRFIKYEPYKGDFEKRQNGSIIALETGTAIGYAIDKLQDRGRFFVHPGDPIYEGQIVGESSKMTDMVVNLTKTKKLSNVRASGSDDKIKLAPPIIFSLEESLEYIKADEYLEVTPKSLRLRKILLKEFERKRTSF